MSSRRTVRATGALTIAQLLDYRPACRDLRLELRAGSLLTLIVPQSSRVSVATSPMPLIGGPSGLILSIRGLRRKFKLPFPATLAA